ncbi:hypothetical protein GJ496_000345 [Pomphorhynchus laevis]|nr:hypothetical protein GJ496_000345 [Pomphorhynchus laevis]
MPKIISMDNIQRFVNTPDNSIKRAHYQSQRKRFTSIFRIQIKGGDRLQRQLEPRPISYGIDESGKKKCPNCQRMIPVIDRGLGSTITRGCSAPLLVGTSANYLLLTLHLWSRPNPHFKIIRWQIAPFAFRRTRVNAVPPEKMSLSISFDLYQNKLPSNRLASTLEMSILRRFLDKLQAELATRTNRAKNRGNHHISRIIRAKIKNYQAGPIISVPPKVQKSSSPKAGNVNSNVRAAIMLAGKGNYRKAMERLMSSGFVAHGPNCTTLNMLDMQFQSITQSGSFLTGGKPRLLVHRWLQQYVDQTVVGTPYPIAAARISQIAWVALMRDNGRAILASLENSAVAVATDAIVSPPEPHMFTENDVLSFHRTNMGRRTLTALTAETDQQETINEVVREKRGSFDCTEYLKMTSTKMRETDSEEEYCESFNVFDKEKNGFTSAFELRQIMTNLRGKFTDDKELQNFKETRLN